MLSLTISISWPSPVRWLIVHALILTAYAGAGTVLRRLGQLLVRLNVVNDGAVSGATAVVYPLV